LIIQEFQAKTKSFKAAIAMAYKMEETKNASSWSSPEAKFLVQGF
jgi:hypothetical protein